LFHESRIVHRGTPVSYGVFTPGSVGGKGLTDGALARSPETDHVEIVVLVFDLEVAELADDGVPGENFRFRVLLAKMERHSVARFPRCESMGSLQEESR
jgi:hypothetical protein